MFQTHIGGVPQWNNEIRGISFITDFTILFQSPLFTRAAKGPEIQADLTSYQLTPSPLLFFLCPLLSSLLLSMCFTTGSHGNYHLCFLIFFNAPTLSLLLNLIYSAHMPLNLRFFSSLIFSFPVCPHQFPLNKIQFRWLAPLRAAVSVYPLSSLLPPSHFHILPLYSLWFLAGFSYLSQKQ